MESGGDEFMTVVGVLLAAGRGRRMGTTKQLLPWPLRASSSNPEQMKTQSEGRESLGFAGSRSSTVVESAFDSINSFCDAMVVVVGHEHERICQALNPRRFHAVPVDPDAEMFLSICAGLRRAIELQAHAVLLQPADHPAVAQQTLEMLWKHFVAEPSKAVMPEHQGSGGHPVIIPRNHFASILAFGKPGGLREFWRRHPAECVRVPVDDPAVTADLDVPSDYPAT